MADIIKMLLQANIDVDKSIIDINEQIKEISKQADAIKIKVDIDKEVFDNIKNINDKLNAVTGKTVKPIKIETPDIEKAKNQFQELNNEISKMSGFDPSKTPIHKGMEIISWSVKDAGDGTKKFTQTLNDGKDSIITYNGVLSKTSGQYEILGKTVRQSTRENQSFLKELDIAIRRSITWMLGMTAVYGSLHKVREGIGFIKELDKELTQVSIITQKTREETYQLAQEYVGLGKQLGKTVKEISSVNTELVRQGLSLEESQQRLLTIMRLNAVSDVNMNPQETLKVITSSVNALKTEAEHASDVILKASQMSASSVSEIGDALTKTASSAQVTGMTIEQIVGIISTLEEVTQESASSLGTSVKTLLARFNKINEETGEINKELNDVQKAFESVGVAFLDGEKQIRPVYDLLSDLNPIWKELDKNTRHYIATMAAGVRQQNRFFAIMENFDRVKEIQNELIDSTGTLDDAFAKYQESAEYAAKRTALAFEQMWLNAINSESIKEFYNLLTAIIELIDKFGMLNVAVFSISFVLLTAQDRLKRFTSLFPDMSWYISAAITDMGLFKGSLFALGTVMDATKVKATLMWTAITLGASYLVTLAIGQVNKLINSYLDLKRSNEELVQGYENAVKANSSNIERLSKLSSEYDKIKNKIENQIDLNEEEKRTLDEIININPSLIKGYDERGQAVIDTTQSIKDMIDTLKRANEIEDMKLVHGGQNLFKQAKKDISDIVRNIDGINQKINDIKIGKDLGASVFSGETIRDTINSLDYLHEKYKEVIKLQGEDSEDANKLKVKIREKEIALANLNKEMSIYEQKLQLSSVELKNALFAHIRLSDSYKDLSSEIKSFVADYIKLIDITDFEDFIDMQVAVDQFMDALNNQDFNKHIRNYQDLKQQYLSGKISAEEFNKAINDLINVLLKTTNIPEDVLSRYFKDSSGLEKINKGITGLVKSFESISSVVKDFTDKTSNLVSAYQTLNEGQDLSLDTISKLLIENEELSNAVEIQNGVLSINKDAIYELIKAKEDSVKSTYLQSMLKELGYQADINDLRREGLNLLYAEAQVKYLKDWEEKFPSLGEAYKRMRQDLSGIEAIINRVDSLDLSSQALFKSSKSTSKEKSPYESQIDALREYQIAIQVIESEIKRYQSYAELTTSEQSRIEYLNKINDLTKQQQDKLHELNNELRKQRDSLGEWLEKQGMGTFDKLTGSFDRTTEGIAKYNKMSDKMKKKIDEAFNSFDGLNNQISTHKLKWLELAVTLENEVRKRIEDAFSSYQNFILQGLEDEIEYWEDIKKKAKETAQTKIDGIQKEIDALEDKNKLLKEEEERQKRLDDIAKQRRLLANIQKERNVRILQDGEWVWVADPKKLAEETEKLRNLQDDYRKWEDEQSRRSQIDKLRKQIKEIQDELKEDERKYDKKIDKLRTFIKDERKEIESQNDWQITTLQGLVASLEGIEEDSYVERMKKLQEFILKYNNEIAGLYGMPEIDLKLPSGGSSGKGSSGYDKTRDNEINDILDKMSKNSKDWWDDSADKNKLAKENQKLGEELKKKGVDAKYDPGTGKWNVLKYKQGGIIDYTGMAEVHGSKSNPEVVFNARQAKDLFNFIKFTVPKLNVPTNIKRNENITPSNIYQIQIDKIFTNDADSFIDLVPTLAIQYK